MRIWIFGKALSQPPGRVCTHLIISDLVPTDRYQIHSTTLPAIMISDLRIYHRVG